VKQKAKRREIYNEIKELRRELRQREVWLVYALCPKQHHHFVTVAGLTTFAASNCAQDAALQNVLRSAQVVLCTLSGAASHRLKNLEFDYVCIDEISQALEAEAWIAALKVGRIAAEGLAPATASLTIFTQRIARPTLIRASG